MSSIHFIWIFYIMFSIYFIWVSYGVINLEPPVTLCAIWINSSYHGWLCSRLVPRPAFYDRRATDPRNDAKVSGIFLRRRRKRILKFVEFCFILMPHVGGRTFTCTSGNIFSPSHTLETIPRDLKQMILVDSFNALKALLREGGWLTAF